MKRNLSKITDAKTTTIETGLAIQQNRAYVLKVEALKTEHSIDGSFTNKTFQLRSSLSIELDH